MDTRLPVPFPSTPSCTREPTAKARQPRRQNPSETDVGEGRGLIGVLMSRASSFSAPPKKNYMKGARRAQLYPAVRHGHIRHPPSHLHLRRSCAGVGTNGMSAASPEETMVEAP